MFNITLQNKSCCHTKIGIKNMILHQPIKKKSYSLIKWLSIRWIIEFQYYKEILNLLSTLSLLQVLRNTNGYGQFVCFSMPSGSRPRINKCWKFFCETWSDTCYRQMAMERRSMSMSRSLGQRRGPHSIMQRQTPPPSEISITKSI